MFNLSSNNTFISTAPVITLASFSFPLTFLYFALATLASVSIGRVLYFKHKFLSFQGGFLSLSLVWSLLRAVMMLFTDLVQNKAPAVYRLLEWTPEVFQLATFSLLVVFFGSIVHPGLRKVYLLAYGLLSGAFLVVHIVVYSLVVSASVSAARGDRVEYLADALTFMLLAVALFVTGVELFRLLSADPLHSAPALAKLGRKSSRCKVSVFVVYMVLVLSSLAIVELLLVLDVVHKFEFTTALGFSWKGGAWFLGYVMWEVIPILIFIISYWPGTRLVDMPASSQYPIVAGMSVNASADDLGRQKPISIREAEPLLSSNLFTNPARYDSDGEEPHHFETASGSLYSPYFTNSPQLASMALHKGDKKE